MSATPAAFETARRITVTVNGEAYERELRDDSGNQLTLGHIERLAENTNNFETLAKLYQAESEKSLDVPRQVDLLSRLARVHVGLP